MVSMLIHEVLSTHDTLLKFVYIIGEEKKIEKDKILFLKK